MNAPLHPTSFDHARPLTRLERPLPARRARDTVAGAAITIAAHAAAIAALLLGIHVAKPPVVARPITVDIFAAKEKPEALKAVMPKFRAPPEITAPLPMFEIAPAADAVTAAPPKTAPPAPPSQVSAPVRDTGESRATYLGLLLAQLNRFKHYPPQARSAHIEGVVMLHFVLDRSGKVLSAQISKSSGRPVLDREALALIGRAQPLPAMPAQMSGDTLDAIVPVDFSLHG